MLGVVQCLNQSIFRLLGFARMLMANNRKWSAKRVKMVVIETMLRHFWIKQAKNTLKNTRRDDVLRQVACCMWCFQCMKFCDFPRIEILRFVYFSYLCKHTIVANLTSSSSAHLLSMMCRAWDRKLFDLSAFEHV